ncbi:MAG: hypothetical protein Q9174_006911, partial [Haloplaca sp. 1 TL-2023]
KGKAAIDEDYTFRLQDELINAPRRRGRLRNSERAAPAQADTIHTEISTAQLNDNLSRPRKAPSSRSGQSPEKRSSTPIRGTSIDAPLTAKDRGMKYLESCDPPIPENIVALLNLLDDVPNANIPSALQKMYHEEADTPQKSKPAPPKHQFLSSGIDPWPPERLAKFLVDHLVETAQFND